MAASAAVAALAGGCSSAASSSSLAPGQTPGPTAATMTPTAVPVLGALKLGTFPATWGGTNALHLCEDWAALRADYVVHLGSDTKYQLEQWFSSDAWQPAFNANGSLAVNPAYGGISLAFGEATTSATASIPAARQFDRACEAADLGAGGPWAGYFAPSNVVSLKSSPRYNREQA
ncbi:MAG TPA: hypothetical protein VN714_15680 [Trebonia sp.]|nr:hypothetical protein [Trebonia sp.]